MVAPAIGRKRLQSEAGADCPGGAGDRTARPHPQPIKVSGEVTLPKAGDFSDELCRVGTLPAVYDVCLLFNSIQQTAKSLIWRHKTCVASKTDTKIEGVAQRFYRVVAR